MALQPLQTLVPQLQILVFLALKIEVADVAVVVQVVDVSEILVAIEIGI